MKLSFGPTNVLLDFRVAATKMNLNVTNLCYTILLVFNNDRKKPATRKKATNDG